MKDALITIGFDKNGEADFGIRADLSTLSLERMNQIRMMIPVAIGTAEDMFRREQEKHFNARCASAP